MKLVIVTGMPGAGKSEVAEAFSRANIPVIVMGDVIRKEVERRGLEVNPKNNKLVMLELRERDGPGAVAIQCVESLKDSESQVVVIEGCRSLAEVDVFDDYAEEVCIVCVHSSPKARFSRLKQRGREDDPQDWETFRERDLREISVGLGTIIALSDIVVVNEGTIEELQNESRTLVQRFT
ncbi:MAG: AAA family ATPase [Candidatus Thorarchaeota archaeon]|jgi:dephospho-CoA kinase